MNRTIGVVVASLSLLGGCASSGGGSGATKEAGPATSRAMTVGDLMAKGGKRLTTAEMKEVHAGATVRGSNQFGNWARKQEADGKFSGQTARYMGGSTTFYGDWRIDDEGRHCSTLRAQGAKEGCSFYYSLDGKHYSVLAQNPSDSTPLEDRVIAK